MGLKKILKKIEIKDAIVWGALISILSFNGVQIYRNSKIKHNLEPNAIHCGFANNFIPKSFTRFPSPRNWDRDKNGKYESVLRWKEGGVKMYQEIYKDAEGRLTLGELASY